MFDIFDDIYIFYILGKFKLNVIDKKDLIIELRKYLTNNGQIFIKFLQLLLINQYKWGDYFTEEEYEEINKILDNVEYDNEKADFKVGCGSVAIVYFKDKYKKKVVKEIIPDIEDKINESFDKMKIMLEIASKFNYSFFDLSSLSSYKNFMLEQINLRNEAFNCKKFSINFKCCNLINVPKIYLYNRYMIEMEYVNGERLTNFLKKYPKLEKDVINLLFSSIYHMIDTKCIHGDFHEGNFLFYIENNKVKMNIIDFGIVNKIDDEMKNILKKFFFENNLMNESNFFFNITNHNYSKDKFIELYEEKFYKLKLPPFLMLELFKENNINIKMEYTNLLFTLISYRMRFKNKYKNSNLTSFYFDNFGKTMDI